MAEDVEIIIERSDGNTGDSQAEVAASPPQLQEVSSGNDNTLAECISSTESQADCIIDVVSTVESQPPDLVSSLSGSLAPDPTLDLAASGSNVSDRKDKVKTEVESRSVASGSTVREQVINDCTGKESQTVLPSSSHGNMSQDNADCDCEIIVDDKPAQEALAKNLKKHEVTSGRLSKILSVLPFSSEQSLNATLGQPCRPLSRSTTPSPSMQRLTPSTPGTPRQRSGSMSGPSPRPSTRNTPSGERQRSGSLGELDMREKIVNGKPDTKEGIRVLEHLDILQLPRPRNPGGVLPQSNQETEPNGNGAVNLVINKRQPMKRKNEDRLSSSFSFTNFISSSSVSSLGSSSNSSIINSTSANTSYLISNIIRTTPNRLRSSITLPASLSSSFDAPIGSLRRWSTSINEGIERPLPSSVVDSEGVAKKIARLENQSALSPDSVGSLWSGTLSSAPETQQFRNLRPVMNRTPPERPKPPRRFMSSPMPDIMPGDRIITPSPRLRSSPASSSQSTHNSLRSSDGVHRTDTYSPSPDHESGTASSRSYKCRVCHTVFSSNVHYMQHMNRHNNSTKMMKCPLCDYVTSEKNNFRRHRRLHSRSSPGGNVLRCGKCSFSTLLPRKLKDHYQFVHHFAFQGPSTEYNDNGLYAPHRYTGSRNASGADSFGLFSNSYMDSSALDQSSDGTERLNYSFPTSNRHQTVNYPMDHFSVSFIRPRQDERLTTSYLGSMVNPDNRQQASSTITSSSYFLPPGCSSSHHMTNVDIYGNHDSCQNSTCSNNHVGVKIKIEPDLDVASDVSSTATPDVPHPLSDGQGQGQEESDNRADSSTAFHRPLNVIRHRSLDSASTSLNNHVTSQDGLAGVSSSGKSRPVSVVGDEGQPRIDFDLGNGNEVNIDTNTIVPSCTVVKSDSTSRGVQCSMAVIKSELDPEGGIVRTNQRETNHVPGVDRAVQCNLFTTQISRSQNHLQRMTDRTMSMSESEVSEQQGSVNWESRCEHCGIAFDDEVIYSIHIGCHSHTDPFVCNVCGKQCGNKYGFYSHIMRGHHF